MNCVPGGASKHVLIQQKKVVLSIEHIMSGIFHACSYDDKWYFGVPTAMRIRKKYDRNFIFTFAVVKVKYGGITTAKIFKHGNCLK